MSKTQSRIRESALRYKHSLGQHFLYDEELLAALVREAGVTKEDDVLEVGPGCGSLTGPLCDAAGQVLAIELDERLIPLLKGFLAEKKNLTLIQGDVMTLEMAEATACLRKPFAVVANIPYYITTPLVLRLLDPSLPVSRLALMVQKEVAEKMLASPGDDGWGPLAIRCQYYCEVRMAMEVPAACFTPPPKVDSAFVVLTKRDEPAVKVRSEEMFFRVAGAAFALRRKTMLNNLCATFRVDRAQALSWMGKAGLDEKIRGEKLTLEQLGALADVMAEDAGKAEESKKAGKIREAGKTGEAVGTEEIGEAGSKEDGKA